MIGPNKEQKAAIENIDNNVAVNAGAGTGKTMVLVERYMEILEKGDLSPGEEIDSIVAITFTKKAAEEMVDRIRQRLRSRLEGSELWARYYREMDRARISTIHSFCSDILRENTIELGIDPNFEILDVDLADSLLEEAVGQALREEIEENPHLFELLIKLRLNYLGNIYKDLATSYRGIRNTGKTFDSILEESVARIKSFEMDFKMLDDFQEIVEYLMDNMAKNAKIHKLKDDPKYLKFKKRDYAGHKEVLGLMDYIMSFTGNSAKFKDELDRLKQLNRQALKIVEVENIDYYRALIELFKRLDSIYSRKKRELAGLDYDDLQILVYKLLQNEEIRQEYQERFRYIMVDEFQDTDQLQRDIFYLLSSREKLMDRKNLFIVGDPKQSIYGFRGGDLEVFYETIEDMSRCDAKIISLRENYRTSMPIMEFLNDLFEKIMEDKYTSLRANKEGKRDIEVELIEDENLEVPAGESSSNYYRNYEAELIARRIVKLVEEGYDYKDLAILFRSRTRNSIYEAALKKYKIPYYNYSGDGFFEKQEIVDSINSIRAILNPEDIISNLGFLRSPMIGLSDLSLYFILKEDGDILDRIDSYLETDRENKQDILEVREILLKLYDLRDTSNYYTLIRGIYLLTGYKDLALTMEDGLQIYLNLEKFTRIIEDYHLSFELGQMDLISYLEDLSSREEEEFPLVGEDINRVQIMTIHKAKGLEFPVVILPELFSKTPNSSFKLAYDKEIGLAVNIEGQDALASELRDHINKKEEEEAQRVLYVAMTRAEERLILGMQGDLSGFKKILEDKMDRSYTRTIQDIEEIETDREGLNKIDRDRLAIKEEAVILEEADYYEFPMEYFSISKYMDFKDCKRRFFYDNILRLGDKIRDDIDYGEEVYSNVEERMNAILKGDMIHKFAELYRKGYDKDLLLEQVSKYFSVDYSKVRGQLEVYVDNFLKTYHEDSKVLREEYFSIKLGDAIFTGIIDRIDIYDDYIDILDYKTNRLDDRNYLYNIYEDQMLFYVHVVSKIFKMDVRKSSLLLLETGEFLNIDYNQEKLNGLLDRLVSFSQYVRTNHSIENYERTTRCNIYCDYYKICNKKRG